MLLHHPRLADWIVLLLLTRLLGGRLFLLLLLPRLLVDQMCLHHPLLTD